MAETGIRRWDLESALKVVGAAIALGGFLWGIWTYRDTSSKQLARERTEATRYADTRRIEATKPFLERQLRLYTEATKSAATIATAAEGPDRAKATKRFWELYWGELALVEDEAVARAMVAFGRALEAGQSRREIQQRSLDLAHACRDSLAASWSIDAWRRPR